MYVFDLDGTLNLKDPKLSMQIYKMMGLGMEFVPATGRTNSYVTEVFKKYHIIPPKFIIADNGGTIYDNRENKYLEKTKLRVDKRETILLEYLRLGGRIKDIRYTDGERVYVVEGRENKKIL